MTTIPAYLLPGDTIGIVCPAGFMAAEKAQSCIDTIQQWGYNVKTGETLGGNSANYFSGPDEIRLMDFQRMLDDDTVNAVLCGRGGYGVSRIIDRIDFKKFRKHPKWIIGYSDITVLHTHIYSNYKISTLHAPMAGAFANGGAENQYVQSLRSAMQGQKIRYEIPVHDFNRKGEGIGELIGGNLCLLAHVMGSASDFKTKGRILFIEDVGEYLYNIDRLMQQLKRGGKLEKLAGLIVGGFTDTKDTERPHGQTAYEIIYDAVRDYEYPVAFGFPVSHGQENLAFKTGIGYKLKITGKKVVLEE